MYSTTAEYKTEIKKPSREFQCKVTVGDRIFTNEDIVDIKIDDNIQPQEGFVIGSTTSQTLDLTLINNGDAIYSTNQIKVEIGLKIGSTIEYILMGYYNIYDIEKTDYTIKITAFDNMIKFETTYFSSLGDTSTLQQVVNELASKTEVKFTGSLPTYNVKKLEGFTCREILSYVASVCGGSAVITRDGKFTIVYPNDINYRIDANNYIDYKREEIKYKIGKITCQNKEKETISKGSLGTDSMELLFENPWVNESILTDIYNRLNGFEYLGYNMKWQGDISLDVGDIITCTDVKGVVRKLPILSQKLTYTGGLTSEIGAKGESKNKNSFSSSGNNANKVNRVVTDLALINKAFIDYAHINDADIKNLKAEKATIEQLTVVEADIKNLKANSATITDLRALNADIENLQADKADITDLKVINGTVNNLNADVADIKTLVSGNISSSNIQAGGITSDSLTIENGFIKDAMIESLEASKITTGQINTSQVDITSESGGIRIADNTMQFKDNNNKIRIQMGEDTNKDFTFALFDESGTGTLIDATGIKEGALSKGLIKENHIGKGAVTGEKVEWTSFVEEFNKDTNTNYLKSSKVEIDETGQKLNVAFNKMRTRVDDTSEKVETATSELQVQQGQIKSLIANTTIEKDGKTTQLKDEYNKTVDTVNFHSDTIASHTTVINDFTGEISEATSKVNEVKKNLDETVLTILDTSKKVGALEEVTKDYNSQINQLNNQIALTVNETEVNEKIDGIKVGGDNLFHFTDYSKIKIDDLFDKANKTAWFKNNELNASIASYEQANNKSQDNFVKDKKVLALSYVVTEDRRQSYLNPYGDGGVEYIELKPNTEYVLSGYAYAGGGSTGTINWVVWSYDDDGSNRTRFLQTPNHTPWTGAFERFEFKITTGSRKYYQFRMYMNTKPNITSGNVACKLYQLKLEEGNKATAWTPSVKDNYLEIDKKINNAKAEIKITTDGIRQSVSKVEQIQKNGGNNLLPNSNWADGVIEGWRITGTPKRQFLSGSATPEDKSTIQLGSSTNVTSNVIYVDSVKVFIAPGTKLTLSIIGACLPANTKCYAYLLFSENGKDITEDNSFLPGYKAITWDSTSYTKKSLTVDVPKGINYCFVRLRVDKKDTSNVNDFMGYFNSIMLVNGEEAATWQPSQKDAYLYSNKKSADIITTVEGITSRVGKIEKDYVTELKLNQSNTDLTASFTSSGGANLLKNSTFKDGVSGWKGWTTNLTLRPYTDAAGKSCLRVLVGQNDVTNCAIQLTSKELNFIGGRKYSLSFKMRGYNTISPKSMKYNFIITDTGNKSLENFEGYSFTTESISGSYNRVKITFIPDKNYTGAGFIIGAGSLRGTVAGDTGWGITEIMLQEGSAPTGWQPHPTEVYNTSIKLNDEGIRCDFADNSYTKLGKDGFKWHNKDNARDYHALSCVGSFNVSSSQNGKSVWITLPSEFKGKNFDVITVLKGWDLGYGSSSFVVDRYAAAHGALDTINGKFEFVGECRVYNKNNGSDIQYVSFNVAYIAIA